MALNNNNNNSNINDGSIEDIKQGSLIVRIDQDSDNNLQDLFDSVLKPGDSKRPLQVPFRMRNLPSSFFHPPSAGSKSPSVSHSRANSTDSAFSTGSQGNGNNGGNVNGNTVAPPSQIIPQSTRKGILISHSRAHSSPASLQQTYADLNTQTGPSAANNTSATNSRERDPQQPTNPVQSAHIKQRSYDVGSIRHHNDLGPLPTGWEQAKTSEGQVYYLNHVTKTTQWEDPRIQAQQQALQQTTQQTITPPKENTAANDSLGPLPEGWEQSATISGDVYFINHVNRTTSWNDPRIPDYLQRTVTLSPPRPDLSSDWVNIKNLEKEREYLKQRQAEIQHQDLLNRQNQQTMGLQMDPFLSDIIDHTRQESGDSGLSLSSNNFLVTPEFLSNIDDDSSMECFSENGNLDPLNGLDNADNLVSSLQLNDNLCNEMLNDVQSLINPNTSKTDHLDWYNKMI